MTEEQGGDYVDVSGVVEVLGDINDNILGYRDNIETLQTSIDDIRDNQNVSNTGIIGLSVFLGIIIGVLLVLVFKK